MDNLSGQAQKRILRLDQVKAVTGLSRSTIYHYMKNEMFPLQVKLGLRCIGWVENDVQKWINERIKAI